MIYQKPYVRANVAALVSPDPSKELLVDKETISEPATEFVAHVALSLGFTETQRQALVNTIVSHIYKHIMDHPEHNSYKGFEEWKSTDKCGYVVQDAVVQFMEAEGMAEE